MHELGIMTGVVQSVCEVAQSHNANSVKKIYLSVGVMTEAFEDALMFAFDALKETESLCKDCQLIITMVEPKSECLECHTTFSHDRFHLFCPACKGYATRLIEGKELHIDSIEVDLDDEDEL